MLIKMKMNEKGQMMAPATCRMTPADHAWQRLFESYNYRIWEDRECCGFYLRTRDAKIWYVGDSRLMECQLHMELPDVILFDFSDNFAHIGLEKAYRKILLTMYSILSV